MIVERPEIFTFGYYPFYNLHNDLNIISRLNEEQMYSIQKFEFCKKTLTRERKFKI